MGKPQKTREEIIDKIKEIHGNKYDVSQLEYVNYKTKVKLICHEKDSCGVEHGEFLISPGHLLNGQGCPKCRYVKSSAALRRSIEDVIKEAVKVHGEKYDYSMITQYKNDRTKYPIICPEHGVFKQTMNNHIKGKQGCPVCGGLRSSISRRLTIDEVIERAKEIHHNKYSYELVSSLPYANATKIPIICQKHGIFYQQVHNHLNGQGCPECGKRSIGEMKRSNTDEFRDKFYEKWGHKYDLSNVEYVNNTTKICVICEKHGEFWTRPHNLLTGYGCPKCGRQIQAEKQCSDEEKELYEFLKETIGENEITSHDRELLKGYEVDYLIPKNKLCIEYDGLYWHSEEFKDNNYHSKKSAIAHRAGFRMIHIFSDEWKKQNRHC